MFVVENLQSRLEVDLSVKKPGTIKVGQNSFGWNLNMLVSIANSHMKELLKAYDIGVPEFACLVSLVEANGSTQSELGRLTGAPEYSTSRHVDRLVQRGFVERRPHPKSRRATCVFLTNQGETLAKKLPPLIKRNNDTVLAGLSGKQRQQLEQLLQSTIDSLRN